MNFKLYLEGEEKEDIKKTIAKLPKQHQNLLKGYKYSFHGGNTLKGDKENIGMIYKDKITVASPWFYSREYVLLHEIAHLVYEKLMTDKLKKEWSELISKTKTEQKKKQHTRSKNAIDQNNEELFCMAYAATYAKHPVKTFLHPEWQKFIKFKVPS